METDPKKLQGRILNLISNHIAEIEQEGSDEFTSLNLTRYLNAVTDYIDNDDKMKKSELKRLNEMSDEEIDQMLLAHAKEINTKEVKPKKTK